MLSDLLADAMRKVVKLTDMLEKVATRLAEVFDCYYIDESWACAENEGDHFRSDEDASHFVRTCNKVCIVRRGLSLVGKGFDKCRIKFMRR